MSDKSQKIAKLLLTAGVATIGIIGVGIFVKYRKNIFHKIAKVKNRIYDIHVPRPFSIEVINNISDCQNVVARLRQ